MGLRLWFRAAHLLAASSGAVTVPELERELGLGHKTAWRMRARVRGVLAAMPGGYERAGERGLDMAVFVRHAGAGPAGTVPGPELPADGAGPVLAGAAAPGSGLAGRHTIPAQLTRFVGRRDEIAAVRRLLRGSRLVTLTGPGGCGKTRLAAQVGRRLAGRMPEGVYWVDLSRLVTGGSVAEAVAVALGLREGLGVDRAGDRLGELCGRVAGRSALVVLDNCEHVLDGVARTVARLLATAPSIRLLATSREPVGVGGEMVWQVPPLATPPAAAAPATLAAFDAVRLFVERACHAQPAFRLDEANASAVGEICLRLDGMPLAVELAAAQVGALTPEEIAHELADGFGLLSGGDRAGPARQRTLRASMDWSHALLGEAERAVFRRLTVFAGGFSLPAAQDVCGYGGVDRRAVPGVVAALRHKSLVAGESAGGVRRYRLLEPVRQYAAERLAESGEDGATRDRHLDHAVALVEGGPTVDPPASHLDLLEVEYPNLRAALDHATAFGHGVAALRLAAGLAVFFSVRAHAEGQRFMADALSVGDQSPSRERAWALWGAGYAALPSTDASAGRGYATAALEMAKAVGDAQTAARALTLTGGLKVSRDPATARDGLEPAVELARSAGDDWALAMSLGQIALSWAFQSRLEQARRYSDEAREVVDRLGSGRFRAWHSLTTGVIAIRSGDVVAAATNLAEARDQAVRVGDRACQAIAVMFGAEADCWRGRARTAWDAVTQLAAAAGPAARASVIGIAVSAAAGRCALTLGELEVAERELRRAAELAGAAQFRAYQTANVVELADAVLLRGDLGQARALLEEGRRQAVRLDDPRLRSLVDIGLARLGRARGDLDTALELGVAALEAQHGGGHRLEAVTALEAVAGFRGQRGDLVQAARLLGAAAAARRRLGIPRQPVDGLHDRPDRARLVSTLDGTALRAALREGATLSLDEAVGYATRGRGTRTRPAAGWPSLTPTELAVARLVAAGLTNPEIGRRLLVSAGTVKAHLGHIYAKTGLSHRAELAAEVTRRQEPEQHSPAG